MISPRRDLVVSTLGWGAPRKICTPTKVARLWAPSEIASMPVSAFGAPWSGQDKHSPGRTTCHHGPDKRLALVLTQVRNIWFTPRLWGPRKSADPLGPPGV